MRAMLFIFIILFSVSSIAAIYKWVDENGKIHYSDKPQANAEVVEVDESTQNTIQINDVRKPSINIVKEKPINYQVVIVAPVEETTIWSNEGKFTVQVSVTPTQPKGSLFVLYIDGKQFGEPQRQSIFPLMGVERGEHNIVVNAETKSGKVLASSLPRKIFLHQTTMLKKR